jgi:hypothetical protein
MLPFLCTTFQHAHILIVPGSHSKPSSSLTATPSLVPSASPSTNAPSRAPVPYYYALINTGSCYLVNEYIPAGAMGEYSSYDKCCKETAWSASWIVQNCLASKPAGSIDYSPLEEELVNDSEVLPSYKIIDITTFGSIAIAFNSFKPPDYNSPWWPKIHDAFIVSIKASMFRSSNCHEDININVWSIAGRSFRRRRRALNQQERRESVDFSVQFEMIIPTKCDDSCQSSNGYLGQGVFGTLDSHFRSDIASGLFSESLQSEGFALDILAGELSYRTAVYSSKTWMPSPSPSSSPTTEAPVTPFPSYSPTTEAPSPAPSSCEDRLFHPNPDFTMCINDDNYIANYLGSLKECCEDVFGSDTPCVFEDICITSSPTDAPITPSPSYAPTSCNEGLYWHPSLGFDMCTNAESGYPLFWSTFENFDEYFHQSLEECCMAVFGTDKCQYDDVCSTPIPTYSPSETVTAKPVSFLVVCSSFNRVVVFF